MCRGLADEAEPVCLHGDASKRNGLKLKWHLVCGLECSIAAGCNVSHLSTVDPSLCSTLSALRLKPHMSVQCKKRRPLAGPCRAMQGRPASGSEMLCVDFSTSGMSLTN